MAKTRSMTRNQSHDDGVVGPWSDVNHDVLFLVMMQLEVIDFIAFGGVCKSWRSFALTNRNMFMASMPPSSLTIDPRGIYKDSYCNLNDFGQRRFKTILPHSAGRTFVGVTCGYVILFRGKTRDFWLVNPITRHELHFPDYPLDVDADESEIKAILVFSPLISGWVLVVLNKQISHVVEVAKSKLSIGIAGKRRWNHISSSTFNNPCVCDLHAFKGKIYTLHTDCSLRELRPNLNRQRKWTLLETNNIPEPDMYNPRLISSTENLYVINQYLDLEKVKELDIDEMKWVSPEKTIGEYAFFFTWYDYCAAIKPKPWAGLRTQNKSYDYLPHAHESRQHKWGPCGYHQRKWYFVHDCLNVNLLDE